MDGIAIFLPRLDGTGLHLPAQAPSGGFAGTEFSRGIPRRQEGYAVVPLAPILLVRLRRSALIAIIASMMCATTLACDGPVVRLD